MSTVCPYAAAGRSPSPTQPTSESAEENMKDSPPFNLFILSSRLLFLSSSFYYLLFFFSSSQALSTIFSRLSLMRGGDGVREETVD